MRNTKHKWIVALAICLFGLASIHFHSDAKIADKDIIAQWSFDKGGKTAVDISGNGHDGTFDLGAKRVQGKFGMGVHLDGGKGSLVTVEDHKDLNVTKQLSIVAWVKWNKGGVIHEGPRRWPMIVSKIAINQAYLLFLDTGDGGNPNKPSIAFRMKGPGTVYSNVTVKDETWYHAAGIYDGKAITVYINGKLSNQRNASAPIATTNDVLTIGANKAGTSNRFDGIIDAVGIYNRGLTAEEVAETMKGFASVEPQGKAALLWGRLKSQH